MAKKKECNSSGCAALFMRLVLGIIFVIAGYGKLTGIDGFVGMLSGLGFPIPVVLAWLVAIVELVGGILLLLGIFSRWAAIPLGVIILVAFILKLMGSIPMPWQYDLVLLAGLYSVYANGPGMYNLQKLLK